MRKNFKQRGAAAVEFAIVLIPLLTIVFGITEFGRAIYQYNTIAKGTRDAARYLTAKTEGTVDTQVQCMAVYGNEACSGSPLAPGLATSMVTICDGRLATCPTNTAQSSNPVVNLITVSVTGYSFSSLLPFVSASLATITFGDISTSMRANL